MDLLRAVMIGPAGTPYHDGLFVFDVHFPPNYPDIPPVYNITVYDSLAVFTNQKLLNQNFVAFYFRWFITTLVGFG